MRVSRRPLRAALLCGAAVLSVGVGVGIATGTTDSPADDAVVTTPAARTAPSGAPSAEGGKGYEGPGTDTKPAPVYGTRTPTTWSLATSRATVYSPPGSTSRRTGTITDRTADIAGTGRVATVGETDWFEVKVPGASTGWVVATELRRR